jgi:aminoacrylate hydrolase
MAFADVGDAQIYYEIHGAGAPVLLISGLRGVTAHWLRQIPDFSRHYSVILHDQRGTGRSDYSDIRYTIDKLTADAFKLMDHLGIRRAHVVGHSTGGAIGQTMALDHPERVTSLTLLSTWTKADPYFRMYFEIRNALLQAVGAEAYERLAPFFVTTPEWVNESAGQRAPTDGRKEPERLPPESITLKRVQALLEFDRTADLSGLSVPTLVVGAQDDRLTPAYFSKQLANMIPGAKLHILDHAGHLSHLTKPAELNPIILDFIGRHKDREVS